MPQCSPIQTKQAYHFSFAVKFTLCVNFSIEAVRIKRRMRLDHELWLTETDMVVVTRCPIHLKFSTSYVLHCWQKRGLTLSKIKHKQTAISESFDNSCMWQRDGFIVLYTLHQTEIRGYLPLVVLHAHGLRSISYMVQRTWPVDTWAKFLK